MPDDLEISSSPPGNTIGRLTAPPPPPGARSLEASNPEVEDETPEEAAASASQDQRSLAEITLSAPDWYMDVPREAGAEAYRRMTPEQREQYQQAQRLGADVLLTGVDLAIPLPPVYTAAKWGNRARKGGKVAKNTRCTLVPYGAARRACAAQGKQAHHVVPDRAFRLGPRTPKAARKDISGGVSENDGLAICLSKRQHRKVHKYYDEMFEPPIGAAGNPLGTGDLMALEGGGALAVASATKCSAVQLAAQLRTYHQARGMGPDFKVRANKSGALTRHLSPGNLGRGAGDF